MSGHSKWSQIKHKKAIMDAKKGKIFSKLAKEIMVAVKTGGENIEGNPRLKKAIEEAKKINMPMENIKNAILKGAGKLPGGAIEEITYEALGPKGIKLIIVVQTDNKNRTLQEIRAILSKYGGVIADTGSVVWAFDRKGAIYIEKSKIEENKVINKAIEAGAVDVNVEDEYYEILTEPENFSSVADAFEGLYYEKKIGLFPKLQTKVDDEDAKKIIELLNELDEHDDVKELYSDFEISNNFLTIS